MPRLLSLLLFVLLLAGCSGETRRARQLERYLQQLKQAPPVPLDPSAPGYRPDPKLDMLDELLRLYPGRQTTKTVVETKTVEVPGKTVYVEVAAQQDTTRNRLARDSAFFKLDRMLATEQQYSELRAEVARLRIKVLQDYNARTCLPDTLLRFTKYNLTLRIKRGQNGSYGFTWTEGARSFSYDAKTDYTTHERVVYTENKYWQHWQFWAVLLAATYRYLWRGGKLLFRLLVPVV